MALRNDPACRIVVCGAGAKMAYSAVMVCTAKCRHQAAPAAGNDSTVPYAKARCPSGVFIAPVRTAQMKSAVLMPSIKVAQQFSTESRWQSARWLNRHQQTSHRSTSGFSNAQMGTSCLGYRLGVSGCFAGPPIKPPSRALRTSSTSEAIQPCPRSAHTVNRAEAQ